MVANLRHSEVGANGEIVFLYLDMVKDHYIDRKWYKYVEYTSTNSKFKIWSSYAYFGGGQSFINRMVSVSSNELKYRFGNILCYECCSHC